MNGPKAAHLTMSRDARRRWLGQLLASAMVITAVGLGVQAPSGATATVSLYVTSDGGASSGCTSTGTGACATLAEAISAADLLTSDDVVINVAASATPYDATVSVADDNPDLSIVGAGARTTTLTGEDAGAVFTVAYDAPVTISGVTITEGESSSGDGGAVASEGELTMTDDTITDSHGGDYGGGVFSNDGTLTLTDDQFTDDYGYYGGAVADLSSSEATLTDDTFSGDSGLAGAGVYVAQGHAAALTDDTFSGDTASDVGGGVDNDGTATLTNDTLVDDAATSGEGGAVFSDSSTAVTTLTDDTLSSDTAGLYGPGVYNDEDTSFSIGDSVLANAGCAFSGGSNAITDGGHNVESENSCGFSTGHVDDTTIDLNATLAANGSPGPDTLALAQGSSAIGEVPAADCTVLVDERGDHRPGVLHATSCDAGAYEFQSGAPSAPQDPRAVAGKKQLTMSWRAPALSGGLAFTAYKVYCGVTKGVSLKDKAAAITSPKVLSAKVSPLTAGRHYYCAVVALNAQGRSPATKAVEATPKV